MEDWDWNYRVLKRLSKGIIGNPMYEYGIVEAYYSEDGYVIAYTQDFINPIEDSLKDLRWIMKEMKKALKQDVIDEETFKPNTIQ